jgi:hypothetical protein
MGHSQNFALDSQCFTYLISALQSVQEPTDRLAGEKVALFRSFLYSGARHFITPTVEKEWRRISDQRRQDLHESWHSVHFGTVSFYLPEQRYEAEIRTQELLRFHPGRNDCLILAEAEILGANKLLSYDRDFLMNLSSRAKIELISPSEHWNNMNVSPGAGPKVTPHPSNPLTGVSWWRV